MFDSLQNSLLKLTDFGGSTMSGFTRNIRGHQDSGVHTSTETLAFTELWIAPEMIKSKIDFSKASDAYAVGLVLLGILSKRLPYSTNNHPNFESI